MTDPDALRMTNVQAEAQPVPGTPVRLDGADLNSIREILAAGRGSNTVRGYRSDLRAFEAWCRSKRGSPALPIRAEVVAAYLGHLAASGRRWATIEHHLAAISALHEAAGARTPAQARLVKSVCRGLRRKLGVAQNQVEPLLPSDLTKIVERAPRTLRWRRNLAMLLLGFAGALRRSELVAVRVEHLHDEAQGFVLEIPRSKTDQEGRGDVVPIAATNDLLCAVSAVKRWMKRGRVRRGLLFGPVDKGGRAPRPTQPLPDRTVALVVKEAVKLIGLDPDDYAGHSLRAGFVTAAKAAGLSELEIMRHTRHKSLAVLGRYWRPTDVLGATNPVRRVLRRGAPR